MAVQRINVSEDEKELLKKKKKMAKSIVKKLKDLGFTKQEADYILRGL